MILINIFNVIENTLSEPVICKGESMRWSALIEQPLQYLSRKMLKSASKIRIANNSNQLVFLTCTLTVFIL